MQLHQVLEVKLAEMSIPHIRLIEPCPLTEVVPFLSITSIDRLMLEFGALILVIVGRLLCKLLVQRSSFFKCSCTVLVYEVPLTAFL